MTTAGNPSPTTPRRTFVLVHGAFHGGWCWARVARLLRAAGHDVFTPTLTGLGERAHQLSTAIDLQTFADDIAGVIECEELNDVILVGHSFAGAPISLVAEMMPKRLRHLVYLDTPLVQPGKSVFDALPPADVALRTRLAQESGGLRVDPPDASAFGLTDPDDLAWANRRLTPHPFSAYNAPLKITGPIGNGLPCTYMACTRPARGEFEANKRWVLAQPNFRWIERPVCHDSMISDPAVVADDLLAV